MTASAEQTKRIWMFVGAMLQVAFLAGGNLLGLWLKSPLFSLVASALGVSSFLLCALIAHGWFKPANLRFSLRDLFWFTLVAAVGIGWLVERVPLAREMAGMEGYRRFKWSRVSSSSAARRAKILNGLQLLSAEELRARMQAAVNWWGDDDFDCCLAELTRRGDSEALEQLHTRMYEKSKREFGGFQTWQVLTALRRSQKQPDPLKVNVEVPHKLNTRPLLIVTLRNVDVERQPVVFTEIGMQKHGRQEQMRAYLTDESGKRVPNSNLELVHWKTHGLTSGVRYSTRIGPGETNAAPFIVDIRKYLAPPPTGRYWLHVEFSDSFIADEADFAGYTICRSNPVAVMVENRSPPPRESFAAYPVFFLLALGALVICVSFFLQLRKQLRGELAELAPWQRYVDWRGLIALAIAALLAYGWLVDVQGLSTEIELLRPHDEADWSLTVAE